jgi:hypothetical protein
MKNFRIISVRLLLLLGLMSCSQEMTFDNTPEGNFKALWQIMDERYCFFEYKAQECGLNWNDIYGQYSGRITPNTSETGLFEILCDMLEELRDGHVNLYTSSDVGRYWSWYTDYPDNFSADIQKKYLKNDYRLSSGLKYKILDDNIGYMYIGSFDKMSESSLDAIMSYFSICNGLILDVRDNGGGSVEAAQQVAARFTNDKVMVGYMMHKTGPGHSEFSDPAKRYIEPAMSHLRWQKTAIVLTNRSCFSATNSFVSDMKLFPNVVVMGDSTGGGGGMPMSSMLPNGWSVRYSASPMLDAENKQIEFGVAPDIKVDMTESDMIRGIDTIIESAREYIKNQLK